MASNYQDFKLFKKNSIVLEKKEDIEIQQNSAGRYQSEKTFLRERFFSKPQNKSKSSNNQGDKTKQEITRLEKQQQEKFKQRLYDTFSKLEILKQDVNREIQKLKPNNITLLKEHTKMERKKIQEEKQQFKNQDETWSKSLAGNVCTDTQQNRKDLTKERFSLQDQCTCISPRYVGDTNLAPKPRMRSVGSHIMAKEENVDKGALGDHNYVKMQSENKLKDAKEILNACLQTDSSIFVPNDQTVNCYYGMIYHPHCHHRLVNQSTICHHHNLQQTVTNANHNYAEYNYNCPSSSRSPQTVCHHKIATSTCCNRRQITDLNTENFCHRPSDRTCSPASHANKKSSARSKATLNKNKESCMDSMESRKRDCGKLKEQAHKRQSDTLKTEHEKTHMEEVVKKFLKYFDSYIDGHEKDATSTSTTVKIQSTPKLCRPLVKEKQQFSATTTEYTGSCDVSRYSSRNLQIYKQMRIHEYIPTKPKEKIPSSYINEYKQPEKFKNYNKYLEKYVKENEKNKTIEVLKEPSKTMAQRESNDLEIFKNQKEQRSSKAHSPNKQLLKEDVRTRVQETKFSPQNFARRAYCEKVPNNFENVENAEYKGSRKDWYEHDVHEKQFNQETLKEKNQACREDEKSNLVDKKFEILDTSGEHNKGRDSLEDRHTHIKPKAQVQGQCETEYEIGKEPKPHKEFQHKSNGNTKKQLEIHIVYNEHGQLATKSLEEAKTQYHPKTYRESSQYDPVYDQNYHLINKQKIKGSLEHPFQINEAAKVKDQLPRETLNKQDTVKNLLADQLFKQKEDQKIQHDNNTQETEITSSLYDNETYPLLKETPQDCIEKACEANEKKSSSLTYNNFKEILDKKLDIFTHRSSQTENNYKTGLSEQISKQTFTQETNQDPYSSTTTDLSKSPDEHNTEENPNRDSITNVCSCESLVPNQSTISQQELQEPRQLLENNSVECFKEPEYAHDSSDTRNILKNMPISSENNINKSQFNMEETDTMIFSENTKPKLESSHVIEAQHPESATDAILKQDTCHNQTQAQTQQEESSQLQSQTEAQPPSKNSDGYKEHTETYEQAQPQQFCEVYEGYHEQREDINTSEILSESEDEVPLSYNLSYEQEYCQRYVASQHPRKVFSSTSRLHVFDPNLLPLKGILKTRPVIEKPQNLSKDLDECEMFSMVRNNNCAQEQTSMTHSQGEESQTQHVNEDFEAFSRSHCKQANLQQLSDHSKILRPICQDCKPNSKSILRNCSQHSSNTSGAVAFPIPAFKQCPCMWTTYLKMIANTYKENKS